MTDATIYRKLTIKAAHVKLIELSDGEKRLVKMLNALGNPARFKMFQSLLRQKRVVGDVVGEMPLAQSTVSQHLRVLQEAGLIFGEHDGTSRCCTPNAASLGWLREQISSLTAECRECGDGG